MSRNKRKATGLRVLGRRIGERRADNFLREFLNLRVMDDAARQAFIVRFQEFVPAVGPGWPDENVETGLLNQQGGLRGAWRDRHVLGREVILLGLISRYLSATEEWPEYEPRPDAYTLVLLRALHIADRMGFCMKADCPAPYFIRTRRGQKFCSEDCRVHSDAVRASKRNWWRLNRGKSGRRIGKKQRKRREKTR